MVTSVFTLKYVYLDITFFKASSVRYVQIEELKRKENNNDDVNT